MQGGTHAVDARAQLLSRVEPHDVAPSRGCIREHEHLPCVVREDPVKGVITRMRMNWFLRTIPGEGRPVAGIRLHNFDVVQAAQAIELVTGQTEIIHLRNGLKLSAFTLHQGV